MSLRRVTIFHFFGFKVKADASWFLLAVLIAWTMATKVYPHLYPGQMPNLYQLMGVATVAGIIASIIAHEVAHAVIAEYYHMPIASITLFIFGGVAEMRGEPSHPKGEFLMAIAGPIMSALMGLFFWSLAQLWAGYLTAGAWSHVLQYLGDLNMLIAGFNLVPAFPLDGGRALRAIIWYRRNNLVLATRVASEYGAAFAYGLIALACWRIVAHNDLLSGIWLGLLGFFVYHSGTYAVRHMEARSLLGLETVSRFCHDHVATVPPGLTIVELIDQYVNKHYQRHFPVVEHGVLVGVISLQAVLGMDRHKWPWLHVSSVMEPLGRINTVSPDASAADALDLMRKYGREQMLVAQDGRFIGVIQFRDLLNYLAITLKIDHNKPVEKSRTAY